MSRHDVLRMFLFLFLFPLDLGHSIISNAYLHVNAFLLLVLYQCTFIDCIWFWFSCITTSKSLLIQNCRNEAGPSGPRTKEPVREESCLDKLPNNFTGPVSGWLCRVTCPWSEQASGCRELSTWAKGHIQFHTCCWKATMNSWVTLSSMHKQGKRTGQGHG